MRFKRMLAAMAAFLMMAMNINLMVSATAPETVPEEKKESEMTEEEKEAAAYQKELEDTYKLPVQSNELKQWPEGPGTYGDAAIVMEAETGAILYAKNIDKKEYPASITKVLTALLALEYGNLSDSVSVSADSLECLGYGYASIGLKENNVITLEEALYATLLASANEAAYVVGEGVANKQGEKYDWFIEQMNEKCRELGGVNSNFINTNGVHDEEHYTCAEDMALISKELFQYPKFFEICQTPQYTIPATATCEEHVFQQNHQMLMEGYDEYYEYAVGGKTGYTTEAENTLVTFADNGELKLVCVVLKTYGGHVYSDTKALLDYGFDQFHKVSAGQEIPVSGVKSIDEDAYVVLPEGINTSDLKAEVKQVSGGDGGSKLVYTYQNMPVGEVKVTTDGSNKNAGFNDLKEDNTVQKSDVSDKKLVKVIIAVSAAVIVVLVLWMVFAARQRRKKRELRRMRRRKRRY